MQTNLEQIFELAVLSGVIDVPNDPTFSLVKWIPQGFSWVDPAKEQKAQNDAVRSGFKSRAEVVSELGYDVEEIDAEIAADKERAKQYGLHFDSDADTYYSESKQYGEYYDTSNK